MVTIEQIRNKIKEAIKQSGFTQTELANKLNIKQPTIGQYLSGRAMPALDTLANLCIILDLDANEILCVSQSNSVNVVNSFNNFSNGGDFKIK